MRKTRNKILIALVMALMLCSMLALSAFAAGPGGGADGGSFQGGGSAATSSSPGDVAGAVEDTWDAAKGQIKQVVDNVVFPIIDLILAVLFFTKIAMAYMDYRKHGQLEWTPIAIIFGCLLFTLTAPLYIWNVVNI